MLCDKNFSPMVNSIVVSVVSYPIFLYSLIANKFIKFCNVIEVGFSNTSHNARKRKMVNLFCYTECVRYDLYCQMNFTQ